MAETYYIRSKIRYEQQDYDLDVTEYSTSSIGYEYAAFRNKLAQFLIFNNSDSKKKITIKNIDIEDGQSLVTANSNTNGYIVADISGVTRLGDSEDIPCTSYDSSNPSCSCLCYSSFSYSSSSTLRRLMEPTYKKASTAYFFNYLPTSPNIFGGSSLVSSFSSADTTPIYLREGEIIGIINSGSSSSNRAFEFIIRVMDDSSNYIYQYNWIGYCDYSRNAIAIENPSGSGQVYRIISIEINQINFYNRRLTAAGYPDYYLSPVESFIPNPDNVESMIPFDSQNTLGDSGISLYRNVVACKRGEYLSQGLTPAAFAKIKHPQSWYQTEALPFMKHSQSEQHQKGRYRDIEIYPGDGVGLYVCWPYVQGYPYIVATLSIEELPVEINSWAYVS